MTNPAASAICLRALAADYDWQTDLRGRACQSVLGNSDGTISLGTGGPAWLSGAPLRKSARDLRGDGAAFDSGEGCRRQLGLGFLGLGMWPDKTRAELPIMPRGAMASCSNICRASARWGWT